MELDPKHLVTLHVIHERGGLTAAAALLGTSQPALSRLVSDMEIRLGAPLFDRSTRPWRMTTLGESLASQGSAVRVALSRAGHAIEQFKGGTEGLIKLGGTPYLSESVLPPLIAAFQTNMPDVRIDQSHAYTAQLLRRLRRREIDLVVAPVDTMDITQGLHSRRLHAAKNIVTCRKQHPLTKLQKPRKQDLLDYRWISPPADSPLAADMRNVINRISDREVRTAFSGGSLSSVAQILEQSDCLAVLPEYVLNKIVSRYTVTSLNIKLSTPTRSVAMITNEDDVRSNLLSVFLDFLEDAFRTLD